MLIEKQLGRHRLLDEAMDILIPKAYADAIEEQELKPVASPDVELVSHEPVVFTAVVPLQPLVDLGDYASVRVPRETTPVTDEQVEETMRELRKRYGTLEPVDRPVQRGDIVRGDLKAVLGTGTIFDEHDLEFRITDESLSTLPGLVDTIVGLKKGDEVETTTQVPDDFEDSRVAGQSVTYDIHVHEIKEEVLADEDDAFAKQVGEGFDSVRVLRDRIREDLQKSQDDESLREYEEQVVDKLVAQATIEYPQVMLDHEIEHLMEDQQRLSPQDPRAQELYLERIGKSEEEIKESVRPEADQRLRRSLVLSTFAEAENISVNETDIDEELQRLTLGAGEQALNLLRLFDTEDGRNTLRRSLLTRKTLNRLVELASQDTAAVGAATQEERPSKARRSAPRRTAE
jgi:trigger factor